MKNHIAILMGLLAVTAGPALADSPRFDADGVYRIPFGTAAAPVIPCSPDKVCSITLEANEVVLDKVAGDTVRWQIVTGVAGARANVPMIFFKPTDLGTVVDPISTNLIITTNRRIYEVRLQAVKSVSRTRYGFTYGGQNFSAVNMTPVAAAVNGSPTAAPANQTAAEGGIGPAQVGGSTPVAQIITNPSPPPTSSGAWALDHNYRIVGDTDYKPVAAWNDGTRTYFQMQHNASSPSIYSQGADGRPQIVNLHGPVNDVYAIDGLPDHIILIGAVGKKVPHVDIYKGR
jgi:type IV secretory pathway VirB9-like protein